MVKKLFLQNAPVSRMHCSHREMCVPLGVVLSDGDDARLHVVYVVALEFVQRQGDGGIHFVA